MLYHAWSTVSRTTILGLFFCFCFVFVITNIGSPSIHDMKCHCSCNTHGSRPQLMWGASQSLKSIVWFFCGSRTTWVTEAQGKLKMVKVPICRDRPSRNAQNKLKLLSTWLWNCQGDLLLNAIMACSLEGQPNQLSLPHLWEALHKELWMRWKPFSSMSHLLLQWLFPSAPIYPRQAGCLKYKSLQSREHFSTIFLDHLYLARTLHH